MCSKLQTMPPLQITYTQVHAVLGSKIKENTSEARLNGMPGEITASLNSSIRVGYCEDFPGEGDEIMMIFWEKEC